MIDQAVLPDELEEIRIKDMMLEELGYTVPWAMHADKDGKLWLDLDFTYDRKRGGKGKTTNMMVYRSATGYMVDLRHMENGDYHWTKRVLSPGNYAPVERLVR